MARFLLSKRGVGVILAAALIVICALLPNPDGLSQEAKMSIVLVFAGLALWLTEAMPNGITAIVLMALMPYFGIFSFSELWAKFMSSAWFFILASFGLTIALGKTSIPQRASVALLRIVGPNSNRIVLGMMVIAAVISMVCSNIAAVTMMVAFSIGLLEAGGFEKRKSRFGKCLMFGVLYGALIGGCATICGGSSHVMLLSITEATYGFTVRFLDWMIVSLPIVAVMLPITWYSLVRIYKPEEIPAEAVARMFQHVSEIGPMPRREKLFLLYVAAVFAVWVASTWVPLLNLTAVAIISVGLLFLPGIDMLDWKSFNEGVSWNLLLTVGGVIALTAGIANTGGMTWLVERLAGGFVGVDPFFVYLFASVFTCIVHIIVPSGSATAGIATLPLMELARVTGANATAVAHIVGWWAGGTFLMPVDSLMLLVYSYGWTDFKDPLKAGIVPTVALIVLSSTLSPWIITTFNIGMPLA